MQSLRTAEHKCMNCNLLNCNLLLILGCQLIYVSVSGVTLVFFINIFMQILSLMELNYLTFERGQSASEVTTNGSH